MQALLAKTAVLKLNGGLGTSMGLEKAKSLLEVKDGKTFLDLIAEQIKYTRQQIGAKVRALLSTPPTQHARVKCGRQQCIAARLSVDIRVVLSHCSRGTVASPLKPPLQHMQRHF